MIKKIIIKPYTLHYRETFTIAYESVDTAEIIIVKIIDNDGVFGLGSAAPDAEVTGETIPQVLKVLRQNLTKDFFNLPLEKWQQYHEKIQKVFFGFPSAQSAVEEAVINLFCQQKKISLVNLFGGYRDKVPMNYTIGIKDLAATVTEVKKIIKQNYKVIKLKCGLNLNEDIKKVLALDKIIPRSIIWFLDANQGYSFAAAKKLVLATKKCRLSLIEQPVKAEDWSSLKKLNQMKILPIIADESAITFNEAFRLLSGNYVAGVNIKLMKCGGPLNFLKIFNLAKGLNKIVMLGCMYESNISLTTALSLALALPIDFVELDSGNHDFSDDPAIGGVLAQDGYFQPGPKLSLK